MKKIIAGLGLLAMVFTVGGTAYAATIDQVNDDSFASIVAKWKVFLNIDNTNEAAIVNEVSSTATSGYNTFSSTDDQTGSTLNTGNAAATSVVDNTANSNTVTVSLESANGAAVGVSNINDESSAHVYYKDLLVDNEVNANAVLVQNSVTATTETGFNSFDSGDSLTSSSATTGSSEAATGISNLFNFNVKEVIRTIRAGF